MSRRRIGAVATPVLLATTTLLCMLAVTFYLRTLLYNYDTRPLLIGGGVEISTPGTRLDNVLRANLQTLGRLPSLRSALVTKPERLLVGELQVDRCPVTQGEFQKFIQWQKLHQAAPIAAPEQPEDWTYRSDSRDHAISGRLTASASGVSYYDAHSYCQAAGGRLPFSEEWIAIAAGKESRLYPWGDQFSEWEWGKRLWPYLNPLLNAAQPCGGREQAATVEGVQDLGILVSEWAQSLEDAAKPTLHGSGGDNRPRAVYCLNAIYRQVMPQHRSAHTGFRCIYDQLVRTTPWKVQLNTVQIEPGSYQVGVPDDAELPALIARSPANWLSSLQSLLEQEPAAAERIIHIMSHEVTRRQYARFLGDPLVHLGLYGDDNEPQSHSYRPADWERQQQNSDLPVSGIDWWSARAFATWAGGRLPTAEEWAAAVSSDGSSLYPWGNQYVASYAVTGGGDWDSVQPGGSATGDFTAEGLADLAGNLSEWTQSIQVTDHSYGIVIKGGNYLLPGTQTARVDSRSVVPPGHRSPTIGLRLIFERERL